MAKGNGSTRASAPSNMYGGESAPNSYPRWMSEEGWKEIIDELAKGAYPMGWDDIDPDHRELALMEAGFTGLADEGAGNIMAQLKRDEIESYVSDQLINMWTGYGIDPDTTITIGYSDGRVLHDEEIKPAHPVTDRQSYATQSRTLRQTAFGRGVDFVIVSGGWGEVYYASEKGLAHIQRYTGYEKWTNGRGEKRRDYIQDDWI